MTPAAILGRLGTGLERAEIWPPFCEPVSDFPEFRFTKREVRRAGDSLRENIWWAEDAIDEIKQTFRVANNWRDSHAFPMRRIRYELIGQIRRLDQPGKTWARLKRMHSIRRKLRNLPENLTQIQDLGGCRAVLSDIGNVNRLINSCRENLPHDIHAVPDDYISNPKPDGYRCYHVVYKFRPRNELEAAFEGRRIEIQVRSAMQHSWATAVEAVGTFRQEDLKAGTGSNDWLRLFQLMASEIALAEGSPELKSAPSRGERMKEIRDLNKRLRAASTLENLRQAFNYVESYQTTLDPKYFLIRYDNVNSTVTVDPYDSSIAGTQKLDDSEKNEHINSVLVEADKIDTLVEGYPNYFGDVQLFKNALANVVGGSSPEFVLKPQATVKQGRKQVPDLSWFRRSRFGKPRGS